MVRQPRPWFRVSCGRWYYTLDDKQHPLGVTDPTDLVGAVREMVGQLAALKQRDPDAPQVREGLVRELHRLYLPVMGRRVKADTAAGYAVWLNWFVAKFGHLTVGQLRAEDVEDAAAAEGWANNTRRICLSVVRGFVRWCGRPGFRLRYPSAESRGAEVVLQPEELDKLLADARGDFGPLLQFWWLTGCRPGEGRQLRAEQVDWANGTVTVADHKLRRKGRSRVIVLCPATLAVLEGQRAKYGSGLLFRNRSGRPFQAPAVKQRMARLRRRVGVRDDVISYSFRHSLATRALEAGKSDSDVAAILGHASTAQLHKSYSHLTAKTQRLKGVLASVNGSG